MVVKLALVVVGLLVLGVGGQDVRFDGLDLLGWLLLLPGLLLLLTPTKTHRPPGR